MTNDNNHFTNCSSRDCNVTSKALAPESDCPHCENGKRVRDPQVPSLLVKSMDGETVQIVPVTAPFSTIKGVERYEHIMMGMMQNMDRDNFYVDDSEFNDVRT